MAKTQMFEIFISTNPSRIAAIEAASLCDAHDRAVSLFPEIDFRLFIVVPTTIERILHGAL